MVVSASIIEFAGRQDIRDLADVSHASDRHHGLMRIGIFIESNDPLCGEVGEDGGESVRFLGWLDLIRALADLVQPDRRDPFAQLPPQAELSRKYEAS
jgi:hypothetical protein